MELDCFYVWTLHRFTVDELGQYHCWYKQAELSKPGIKKTRWKDLPSDPQDDSWSSYTSATSHTGQPKITILWPSEAAQPVF